ncbi:MAG: hypothetical protein V1692_01335, partial [bacterium]
YAIDIAHLCKKYNLVFGCHTRPDCETEELIREFSECGCLYMFSGLESAVPEILLGANKTTDPEGYKDAYLKSYHLKKELGIPVSAFMIHGMPRMERGEKDKVIYKPDTIEDSIISIEFAVRQLDTNYLSMNVLRFLPATPFSSSPRFQFLRPGNGELHGGYWDDKWIKANNVSDSRCFHPILRAFEGSGSHIPTHMTPERCYKILEIAVNMVNAKNQEPNRQQTRIVVDHWFKEKFLIEKWGGGKLTYQLAPFSEINNLT